MAEEGAQRLAAARVTAVIPQVGMTSPKSLDKLIEDDDPCWPSLTRQFSEGPNLVEVMPVDRARSESTLVALQVTTRSPLGGVALETGGVLFDRGWVRLLGGGSARARGDLAGWNGLGANPLRGTSPGQFVVGYDVIGGFFAINAGAFEGTRNNVFYFSPDSLQWEDLGRGYGDFLSFLCVGDLAKFYTDYRWLSWESDVAQLAFDQVFHILPPLWTREGKQVEQQDRRAVPALELFELQVSLAKQLAQVTDGTSVNFKATE